MIRKNILLISTLLWTNAFQAVSVPPKTIAQQKQSQATITALKINKQIWDFIIPTTIYGLCARYDFKYNHKLISYHGIILTLLARLAGSIARDKIESLILKIHNQTDINTQPTLTIRHKN